MASGGVVVYLCRYTSATNFEIVVVLSAMRCGVKLTNKR